MSEAYSREVELQELDHDQLIPPPASAPVAKYRRRASLAQALFSAAREPLILLDRELRLVAASRSFYDMFQVDPARMLGQPFHEFSFGRWDVSLLGQLLHDLATGGVMEPYEVELDVPDVGRHPMLLNARQIWDEHSPDAALLVGLEDQAASREVESLRGALLRQKHVLFFEQMLLREVQHRVANSLQIIASILLLKARAVGSEETRLHLRDMRERVISIAAVQRHLSSSGAIEDIECGPYLSALCEALAQSMIADNQAITVTVSSTKGTVKSPDALGLGLIATELVMNALKHGFPDGRAGHIAVEFAGDGLGWRLSVSDDGIGRQHDPAEPDRVGLGTSIIEALARQLKAEVEIYPCHPGTTTAIVHAA